MDTLWQIMSGAPWWAYVLFLYLVSIGIKAMKPRAVSMTRVILFPLIFAVWFLYGMYINVSAGFPSLILWAIVFLALGVYLGFKEVCCWPIQVDRKKGSITIPGNYSTLILVILIFCIKFFWGALYAILTPIPHWVYLADTITSSVIVGFFIGRGSCFCKRYLTK